MNDWKCRNCGMRFVPTYWVGGAWATPETMVARCIKCGSNATEEIEDDKNE